MRTPYFGPEYARKQYEVLVPTPVGELCGLCEEEIEPDDMGTIQAFVDVDSASSRPVHHECSMRAVIGSVAHVEGRCSCVTPGAEEGDPPGMSRREAARAALHAFNNQERRAH